MSSLMESVSGVRGIVGESLTTEVVMSYASAFADLCNRGTIVVGRDTRVTGEMVENVLVGALLSMGCKVVKIGIAPTPTTEYMVSLLKADGAIIITASHNPPQWNALKFVGSNAMFLGKADVERLKGMKDTRSFTPAAWDKIFPVTIRNDSILQHVEKVLSHPFINVEGIRSRKFKVVLDANHGTGALLGKELLTRLGCELTIIGKKPDGQFEHPCEPIPENIRSLRKKVAAKKADIGFATDPDADRLALVSEIGEAIGEERTLAFATQCVLSKRKGPLTINLSTSQMSEDIASSFGCKTIRTAVGEINVSSEMVKNGSVIGGEGNGGIILPDVVFGRDSAIGMALCLQLMVETGKTVSGLAEMLPSYTMLKEKVELGSIDPEKALEALEKNLPAGDKNTVDGLRIAWGNSWVHVRKSNTEPIVRITLEARTAEETQRLFGEVKRIIAS